MGLSAGCLVELLRWMLKKIRNRVLRFAGPFFVFLISAGLGAFIAAVWQMEHL
ncbi:hypothetical protein [Streptomyces noursei]|uniref:hypothetical protein n=1 Tax=Streptomyces noursei TaxID=1971 RepID=UPI0016747EB5|nr:hypothetical protein [Streptomyces noursei]MCZ1015641.1 hypothetical protein [Streptomyces noursei]GGW89685.1 hypothetical protein GCM10010341_08180 [Streptomyces noursei]